MHFFEHQRQARSISRRLLWLYSLAVTVVVVLTATFLTAMALLFVMVCWKDSLPGSPLSYYHSHFVEFWVWPACIVLVVVLGGTVIKLRELSHGGHVVAEAMGGQQVLSQHANAEERRLLNVVEEMAIAAGLPMPKVYLIDEDDINAFAAGLQPTDAVIAVTRGALDTLSRDELQAVVGHEFSHIFNGDMNINMYLTGLLYGLEMIWLIGRKIWNEIIEEKSISGKISAFVYTGLFCGGLMLLGFTGSVLAGWIRAAVSRQRELLADASSVQFTRQKDGLLGALMKMANAPHRMFYHRAATAEYAHFFFGSIREGWLSRLAATHPSIFDRMARLDPQWARQWAKEHPYTLKKVTRGGKQHRDIFAAMTAGFNVETVSSPEPTTISYWLQPISADKNGKSVTPLNASHQSQQVLAEVEYLNPGHMRYAAQLRQQLPDACYQASQDSEKATALMCILLLSDETNVRAAQQALIAGYSRPLSLRVKALLQKMPVLTRNQILPLLDLMLPALADLPATQQKSLRSLWQQLMTADNQLNLHEWCVWTVLNAHLFSKRTTHRATLSWQNAVSDIGVVLAYSAYINDVDSAPDNYHTVAETLSDVTLPEWASVSHVSLKTLQAAVQRLSNMNEADKARVLQAALIAIQADGRIDVVEREWMRALTAAWHYPMPPLLPQTPRYAPDPAAK